MRRSMCLAAALLAAAAAAARPLPAAGEPISFSGRYPHLAVLNDQGECGIGAVAAWADRLWMITYSPHCPGGSNDKLYEIDAGLGIAARPESVGGTPANRLVHRESNQLIIGPYFIDAKRSVRVIPPSKMFGRLTATARHLVEPEQKVYFYDMEGLLYEVDVRTLEVKLLYARPIPGWHGKGGYTGQGRLVLANNGESPAGSVDRFKPFEYQIDPEPKTAEDVGALAEWDGRQWRLVARRQFNEVSGPGGIYGAPDDRAPLWAVGWDRRSVILKLCDGGRWSTYRLAMADYSYRPAHGWYTEWPRIREVVPAAEGRPPKLLMNIHGGWFDVPIGLCRADLGGLAPIGSYLKITADFGPWQGRIVFGCDDTSIMANPLAGQSQSNLWFADWEQLHQCGRPAGWGGPWVRDDVAAGVPSDPFLVGGYAKRVLHLAHRTDRPVTFLIEADADGRGRWQPYAEVTVPAGGYAYHVFPADFRAAWVRLRTDVDCRSATAYFHLGPGGGAEEDRAMFAALADAGSPGPCSAGIIRPRGGDLGTLQLWARRVEGEGSGVTDVGYYETGPQMELRPLADQKQAADQLRAKAEVEKLDFGVDRASAFLVSQGTRYRLPRRADEYDASWGGLWPRGIREVVTERSLFNAHGTFYMLPRQSAGGVAAIKPVCTHDKRIADFCSWRGLLVIAGTRADAKPDGHYVASADGRTGLWFGDVDDLWKLGKPRGKGGPWNETPVEAGKPSDPYLMTGYDRKTLELKHDANVPVTLTVEVDFLADGTWHPYAEIAVPPGQTITHRFPDGFAAHWVRLKSDRDTTATATLTYQ